MCAPRLPPTSSSSSPLSLSPTAALVKLAEARAQSDTRTLKKVIHAFYALVDPSATGDKLFVPRPVQPSSFRAHPLEATPQTATPPTPRSTSPSTSSPNSSTRQTASPK